jgi:predicted RNA polymerase sigma factor
VVVHLLATTGHTAPSGEHLARADLAERAYLWSTKAELLRRLDRHEEAGEAYREALRLTENATERAFIEARLD